MKEYKLLGLEDRLVIEAMIKLKKTCREMTIEMGRSESTIRREITNNRHQTLPNPFNNDTPTTCSCCVAFPYVCNSCSKNNKQKVYKYFYRVESAQRVYESKIFFFACRHQF